MATSLREASKAVSEQIMKMYGWLANLLVIVNVFANKSLRCRACPFDTDLETTRNFTHTGRVELKQWYIKYSNNAPKHSLDTSHNTHK